MTTLKGIKGDQIRYLDEDPVVQGVAGGTWASATALNTGRDQIAGDGPQNAAYGVGGSAAPGVTGVFELYNGSTWTESTDLNVARRNLGTFGTQTSALAFNGQSPPATNSCEQWNGTSWTEVAEMNLLRIGISMTAAGTSGTSGVQAAGYGFPTPGANVANTESWNGTVWTELNDMNSARQQHGQAGTATAALSVGGTPGYSLVEQWDGTNWTEIAEVNQPRKTNSLSGTSTIALTYGGDSTVPTYLTNTESWNGTSWTEVADLSSGRGNSSRAGSTNASALMAGGNDATLSALTTTEEFTTAPITSLGLQEGMLWFNSTSQTLKGYGTAAGIPAGTWASGGTMNQGRLAGSMGGTQTDAIYGGGLLTVGSTVNAETYDGSTWTEVNNLSTARYAGTGFGTSTPTTMIVAGIGPGPTVYGVSESWNGTSWTEVADLNTSRWYLGGASSGTNTDGLVFGGFNQGTTTQYAQTEAYNGTSWAEVNDLNTAKGYPVGFGTPGSAGSANGFILPATYPSPTEIWDGTSWTNTGQNFNTPRSTAGGSAGGSSSSGMVFGGQQPGPIANTEYWNGSTWTELADLSVGNEYIVGTGSTVSALGAAGDGYTPASEEWNAPAAVVTVTTS